MRETSLRAGGLSIALAAGLLILLMLSVPTGLASSPGDSGKDAGTTTWTRTLDPVVLSGDQLSQFDGVAMDELFVYAYSGGVWEQIPYQFDEVDASGAYTVENGLLDANDELVFMAMDLGEAAQSWLWLDNASSRGYARHQVLVSNPLIPGEQGWVYVYRSDTLVPGFEDYVAWDSGNHRMVGGTYAAGFDPEEFLGLDSLELNNSGVDALDRTKLRAEGTLVGLPFAVTEEDEGLIGLELIPNIDGAVRVGGGTVESAIWSYHSIFQTGFSVDLDSLPEYVELNSVRVSFDWRDPAISGMGSMVYYDSNTPGGVPIDGSPDGVPPLPASPWMQTSGELGSTVLALDLDLSGGTHSSYYKDESAVDPEDTGDQMSFGDAGFHLDSPAGQMDLVLTLYVMGSSQPKVGDLYYSHHQNPLESETESQVYRARWRIYLPYVSRTSP